MTHYEPSIPRVALGIAAAAMTAITLGVSVVMPAQMDSDRRVPAVLAASDATKPASTGVVTNSTSIEVVAVREPGSSAVPCNPAKPNHRSES